jgi:chromosome segregation ATPase
MKVSGKLEINWPIMYKLAHNVKEITKHEFEVECNKIRSIIDNCPDITEKMKYDYKQRLDLFEKEDAHKKLDELLSANNDLKHKQNEDAKKIGELNQKLENFEIKLADIDLNQKQIINDVNRINDSTQNNTKAIDQQKAEIKKIKKCIDSAVVRYKEHVHRVNIKFLIKKIFILNFDKAINIL